MSAAAVPTGGAGAPLSLVLREVEALDLGGGFARADVAVVDGRIAAVGRDLRAPGLPSVDGAGLWLLPGVVDCHAHLGLSTLDRLEGLATPASRWALETADNARRTLLAGVTTLRDAGGADAGIREAIELGFATGPRLQVSTVMLSQTGGHADGFLPGLAASGVVGADALPPDPARPPAVVDGPEQMRLVVRQLLRGGSDWIKLCTTGGVLSAHDDPRAAELTDEEVAVAVFEAARRGRGVMAHANGGEGLDLAVRNGVRSIEHGLFLTEEQAHAMAAAGCWLVPTLTVVHDVLRLADAGELPPHAAEKAGELRAIVGEAVAIARAAGVPIALGSDLLLREQHGRNLEEIVHLRAAGMSPEEALLTATIRGAELCGVAAERGSLEPGKAFDAIVLDGDPGDLSPFARPGTVTGVFRDGVPVLPHPRLGELQAAGAAGAAAA
ncbi:metal-dependent hydrolase family protein [Conexibacter arvalis]|uniref:Imidazolonepropionase-like amidohydrolase n=1 Tax=Conexibacter arvalis TaxID=912552 RepID=A0A840ILU9_9ACTN|nr:amidohydrolase family protein [Conexibacter arvalis]MBB4665123.1 imidazolonepropionase-like amidohydrolase [Conexibacter arvalis]